MIKNLNLNNLVILGIKGFVLIKCYQFVKEKVKTKVKEIEE